MIVIDIIHITVLEIKLICSLIWCDFSHHTNAGNGATKTQPGGYKCTMHYQCKGTNVQCTTNVMVHVLTFTNV